MVRPVGDARFTHPSRRVAIAHVDVDVSGKTRTGGLDDRARQDTVHDPRRRPKTRRWPRRRFRNPAARGRLKPGRTRRRRLRVRRGRLERRRAITRAVHRHRVPRRLPLRLPLRGHQRAPRGHCRRSRLRRRQRGEGCHRVHHGRRGVRRRARDRAVLGQGRQARRARRDDGSARARCVRLFLVIFGYFWLFLVIFGYFW